MVQPQPQPQLQPQQTITPSKTTNIERKYESPKPKLIPPTIPLSNQHQIRSTQIPISKDTTQLLTMVHQSPQLISKVGK